MMMVMSPPLLLLLVLRLLLLFITIHITHKWSLIIIIIIIILLNKYTKVSTQIYSKKTRLALYLVNFVSFDGFNSVGRHYYSFDD